MYNCGRQLNGSAVALTSTSTTWHCAIDARAGAAVPVALSGKAAAMDHADYGAVFTGATGLPVERRADGELLPGSQQGAAPLITLKLSSTATLTLTLNTNA